MCGVKKSATEQCFRPYAPEVGHARRDEGALAGGIGEENAQRRCHCQRAKSFFAGAEREFDLLPSCDVRMRANHAHRATMRVAFDDGAASEHPAPVVVGRANAHLEGVGVGTPVEMITERLFAGAEVQRMQQVQERVDVRWQRVLDKAEHGVPSRRVVAVARRHVPVPEAIPDRVEREPKSLFARAECDLVSLLRRDIAFDGHPLHVAASWSVHRHDVHIQPERLSLSGVVQHFLAHAFASAHGGIDAFRCRAIGIGPPKHRGRATDHVGAIEPGGALERFVDIDDAR